MAAKEGEKGRRGEERDNPRGVGEDQSGVYRMTTLPTSCQELEYSYERYLGGREDSFSIFKYCCMNIAYERVIRKW